MRETEWDVSTIACPGLWPVLRCYFVYVRSQLWPLLDTESLPQIFEGWGKHQVHMVRTSCYMMKQFYCHSYQINDICKNFGHFITNAIC